MRAIALLLLLAAFPAAAGKIHSLEPSEFHVNSDDVFMIVGGIDLGNRALFSGPAGTFIVDVSFGGGSRVHVWVPVEILNTVGWHGVQILGGPTGDSNVAGFRVIPRPPPPPLPFRVHMTQGPLTVATSTKEGEIVFYDVWTSGGKEDPKPAITCNPPSGSRFRLGTSVARCEAVSAFGETASTSLQIIVYDAAPPELTLPDDIVVPAEGADGATVTYQATAHDAVDGGRPVTCAPASGSRFPIGVTTVKCSANDLSYNPAHGSFTVEVKEDEDEPVRDTVPPVISGITATPDVLSPPNHKMVEVTIDVAVSDLIDPMPHCAIFDVTSSDDIGGDVTITDDLVVELRAERSGSERVYEVHVRCTDASHNATDGSVAVRVPKGNDQNDEPARTPRRKGFRRWW